MSPNKRLYSTFSHDLIDAITLLRTRLGYRSDSEFLRALVLYEVSEPRRDDHHKGRHWASQVPLSRDKLDHEMLLQLKARPTASTEKIRLVSNAVMQIGTRRLGKILDRLTGRRDKQSDK